MDLSRFAHRIAKFAADNSPTLLSAVGVTGALTTAYLTGKASFRAAEIIRDREEEDGYALDPKIRLKHRTLLVWKLYIPAAGTAALTVSAIIAANRIGVRRAAAMASAFAVSERLFEQYKDKVTDRLGESKERALRDEIAQDNVTANPPSQTTVIITDGGHVLCRDDYSGRYFKSSMEELKKAQNDIAWQILNEGDASLTDFYNMIGLPPTSHSDEVGWNTDEKFELMFSGTIAEDNTPCISFIFRAVPIRDYYRMR